MKQYCRYHPTQPAHWHCEKCDKVLCPQCVDIRDLEGYHQGEKLHMCPSCNIPVQWMGVANILDPFWKRMPQFFLYPFSSGPMLLMALLALIASIFIGPGNIGKISAIFVWGVIFKYAFSILQATAGGDLTPPKLSLETLSDNFGPVVKQIGIFLIIFGVAGITARYLGLIPVIVFIILAILFMPAMLMLLVTTDSLFHAVNPLMFISLTLKIGWGYLLMYFFLLLLGTAPALMGNYVLQYLPQMVQVFLFTIVQIYYTFITYHLMGYVILQYHESIGYRVEFENFKDGETEKVQSKLTMDDPQSRLLLRINQMIKDGDHTGAVKAIEDETSREGITDPLLSERYYTLLTMIGVKEKLTAHGRSHLDLLVHADQREQALAVYHECRTMNPAFLPSVGALFKLGSWLNESGKSKEAIHTFNQLAKAYPQDPLVPKSYFRAAQILNEQLSNPEKAGRILSGLLKKYPDHDIIPFVERYLRDMG